MNAEVTKEGWKDKDVEVQRAESGGTLQSRLACSPLCSRKLVTLLLPQTGCGSGTAGRERCG